MPTLAEVESSWGYTVDALNYSVAEMPRFYSGLEPVSHSNRERFIAELEACEKAKRQGFRKSFEGQLPVHRVVYATRSPFFLVELMV